MAFQTDNESPIEIENLGEVEGSNFIPLLTTGSFEMKKLGVVGEELGEPKGESWSTLNLPLHLKWDGSNNYLQTTDATGWGSDECLHFRDAAKVDAFFCADDPAGEALWMHAEGKLQSFGDPTQCLSTTTGEHPKLVACTSVAAHDQWEIPRMGAGYGQLKSKAQGKCVLPVQGQGARAVELVDCGEETTKWKATEPPKSSSGQGMCTMRWPKDAEGKTVYSNVPQRRSCFSTTGTDMGQWSHELVMEADINAGFSIEEGRLLNHRIGDAPLGGIIDAQQCATKCRDTDSCRAFNYEEGKKECELVSEKREGGAPMDFDQGSTATGWKYHEPKTSTVNTKCIANCLPSQVARIDFPITGAKFEVSAGKIPSAVATHFDSVLFGGLTDLNQRDKCFANVDAIVVEANRARWVRPEVDSDLHHALCRMKPCCHCTQCHLVICM
jgi:hypothetical protein